MGYVRDGFKTLVTFANYPSVRFQEKTVTPPGMDGGGPNDTTTMRNTKYRTKQPKKLISMTNMSLNVVYDPLVYNDIVLMVNTLQLITVTFADGTTNTFWGWLDKFTPGEAKEGEQPTADVVIECSNQNSSGAEVAPVIS